VQARCSTGLALCATAATRARASEVGPGGCPGWLGKSCPVRPEGRHPRRSGPPNRVTPRLSSARRGPRVLGVPGAVPSIPPRTNLIRSRHWQSRVLSRRVGLWATRSHWVWCRSLRALRISRDSVRRSAFRCRRRMKVRTLAKVCGWSGGAHASGSSRNQPRKSDGNTDCMS